MWDYLGRAYITNVDFILNLALICDSLQELSELSLKLHSRDIENQMMVFKNRKAVTGAKQPPTSHHHNRPIMYANIRYKEQ